MEQKGRGAMVGKMMKLLKGESGQSLAEYGLIVGLIAVVAIAAVTLLGTNITSMLNSLATAI
jgi:pilus assembly protein Flp/PilA